jgi:hypothetical protein
MNEECAERNHPFQLRPGIFKGEFHEKLEGVFHPGLGRTKTNLILRIRRMRFTSKKLERLL